MRSLLTSFFGSPFSKKNGENNAADLSSATKARFLGKKFLVDGVVPALEKARGTYKRGEITVDDSTNQNRSE